MIRYHHIPDHTNAEDGQPLVKLVNIAEKVLPDFANTEHTTQSITEQECTDLGIDPSKADAITEEIGIVVEQAKQLADIV